MDQDNNLNDSVNVDQIEQKQKIEAQINPESIIFDDGIILKYRLKNMILCSEDTINEAKSAIGNKLQI
jgi:hypothetical protein